MAVDWDNLRDGFTAALQLEPELRLPFVHHLAGPNEGLRRELEALVRAHVAATAALTLSNGTASLPSVNAGAAAPPADPRFSIQYRIGEGGMGTVYLAIDTEHGARVALKTIGKMSASSLLHFKNEFRALADVAHPNLVRLFELRGDGMTWFFTMEFVEGMPFLRYVRRIKSDAAAHTTTIAIAEAHPTPVRPVQPIATALDEDKLRLVFPQLVEAVAAIHAAGKLHCDLKPSNVLVAADTGRVVVLDFGLITEIDAPIWATSGRSVVGTVAFMSPEQARAEALSEASDWYSVGVILYQALTGRLPVDGADFVEILTRKQTTVPMPPRELDPSAPDDLSRLAMQLLDRDPRARPDGREILRRLERRAPHTPESKGAFIGRAAQLAQLHDALRDVRAGTQKTAYVHGASGAGKSALIRQFLHEVPATVLVLSGRCYERESVPYKALDSVMDAIARQLADMNDAAEFLDPDVAYLARVFPVLSQVAAVREIGADAAPIADVQEIRRRASRGLRHLLRRLSGRYLLVVSIDDLQWSDLDSTMLIQSLLAAPHAPRLLFLGSYRSEHADSSPVLTRLLQQDSTALKVHVGQLSDDEARALARSRLGARVTADAIEMIVREARGVPLFVEQLAHALDEAGTADHEGLSFDTVLRRRLAGLDPSSRRLLEHIVVGGQPLPQAAIVEAAGIPPEQALRDLAALRAQQWVRGEGLGKDDNIEPFHDRIRESIVEALSADELISRHQALAQALEPIGVDPEILVVHWSGCGRYEKATHYARRAADRAAETLAFNRAARLYGQALEWQGPDSADARALEQSLADALAHAGLSLEAGDAYLRASRHRDVAEALLFKQRAAEQYLNHGHVEKGFEVLDDLVKAVGLPMPKHGLHAVIGLQIERLRLWARGIRRVRPPRVGADIESLRLDVCLTVGRGLSMIEPIRGAEYQTRACRLALDIGDPKRIALTLAIEAALEATAGYRARRRVARLLERSDQVSAQLDDVRISAHTRFLRGTTHYLQGEWAPALECCRDAEGLFRERCKNAWWEIDQSASFAMWTLNHMGRMAEVARRRGPLLKEASERGDRMLRSHIMTGNNVLAPLSQGEDPERVRAELVEAVRPFGGQGYHMPHLLRLFGLVEIELFRQDGRAARAMFDADLRHIRSSLLMEVQFLRIEVLGQRARCGLAAAAAEPRARRRYLAETRRCARALARIGSPWSIAYATPLQAELALIDGNTEESIALLKTAIARYDELDMNLRAAAAAYRLGDVVGGGEGRAITAASSSRMRMLGVTNPGAIAGGFMPSMR